ncbi:hypothetical protein S83_039097 [Arachis hypogaea]
MERLKIIKPCMSFYEEMRSNHEELMLFFVLTLFVYFRDRTSGQLSLGGRMNSRIRREALERAVGEGDKNCIWELRMNTNAFANLCELLQVQGGITEDGHVSLPEQIQSILFAKATPVEEDCLNPTWRSGWKGSASNPRVLRDAITRRNSLKIPHSNYYLVDAGYTNGLGFLAPYRGTRYHSMDMDSEEEGSILDEFMLDGDEEQDEMIDVVENTNE